ncbi:YopT-type cysteine protease domain-containing protein [Yersinia enterocolitica]|uniref:YopT-type cysteine protease domain-containing protein n=1 Tax=Yersinia enterocolitica TaxID=630 RepID=UPI003AB2F662
MSLVDEIRNLALECNCSYKPFSQVEFFKDDPRFDGGVCAGVSLSWIEVKVKRKLFLDDNVLDKDLIIKRQRQRQRQRQSANRIMQSHIDGFIFKESLDKDGEAKSHDFIVSSDGFDISRMLSWTTPFLKQRYFLVTTDHHCMAMCNTRFGGFIFFDPNCGEISGSVNNMRNFLVKFFRIYKVRNTYWRASNYSLKVTKFK